MRRIRLSPLVGTALGLVGCSGLGQMQDTITKFDQGAHSAETAETSYFQAVQKADCNQQFYVSAFNFATAPRDKKSGHFPSVAFDATGGKCTPVELTNDEFAIRQKLMQTLTLYADAIQALAGGTDNKTFSTNSQNLAAAINKLAQQQGITLNPTASVEVAALNTAVVAITQMIFDRERFKDIKAAAAAVQKPIHTVIDGLKAENSADAAGLASKADALGNEYQSALLAARDREGAASFIDAVQVRLTYQSIVINAPDIAQLNAALDALVAANDALANADQGGAIAEVSDLISRAQQANTLFNSLK